MGTVVGSPTRLHRDQTQPRKFREPTHASLAIRPLGWAQLTTN